MNVFTCQGLELTYTRAKVKCFTRHPVCEYDMELINCILQVSLEDFLESCRAPALLTELEDDDEGDDALDSDKENEPTYQEVVST